MTSLALLIADYRAGLADYEANHPRGDDDAAEAYLLQVVDPPYDALIGFDGAATSRAEAHLALEDAEKALGNGDVALAKVLVRSARLFLREVTPKRTSWPQRVAMVVAAAGLLGVTLWLLMAVRALP